MASEDTDLKQRSSRIPVYRFLGGVAFGAALILVPISYGASVDWNLFQIGLAVGVLLFCGVLSSVWGEKFMASVMGLFENFGP
jgi:hypothetical protein